LNKESFQFIKMIKLPPNFRQFIKFCIVGGISTIVDVGTYTALTRTMDFFMQYYLLANAISFIIALANSYILNRRFTFKSNHKKVGMQFAKYASVYTIGLGLSEAILYTLVDRFGMHDLIAKACAIGVVLFWNFIGSKFFIFDRDSKKDLEAFSDSFPG